MKTNTRESPLAKSLGKLLLYCILVVIIIFVLGLTLFLITDSSEVIDAQLSLQEIADSIASIEPIGILGIGIIIVVITPLLRLMTTILISIRRQDRIIAIMAVLSFATIIISFILRTITQ